MIETIPAADAATHRAAQPASAAAARGRSRRGALTPYLFVGPAFALLVVFGIVPILVAAGVSVTDLDLRGLGDTDAVRFIGLDNYRRLFGDGEFWSALGNTGIFIALGVPVIIVGSLAVAIALSQSSSRFFRLLTGFYFLPAITAIVAISLIWGYLLNGQFGLINYVLGLIGVDPVPWLSDPMMAKFSVALVAVWRASGLNIVIFLAALQSIPKEYYEAASLDGAGEWRKIISVTVPLLRFAIFFVTVTTLIGWMQFFDEPYVLTRGGPTGSTTSISLYIYQQGFQFNEFGFASAASLVLFVIIFAVTAIQLRARRLSHD
ncbi:carbohydrate ABC transporter permease [Micromonospora thermarum]|uniref:Sugar ABC transporter permease n=1 Tax=Micromonospora thermarum TaxID=2720024 RepID=A0ABX0ZGD5_9ACTN|nr:sugar ABC transporter permease [Micromonospora thermarum]NJP35386.1 sugar ABC transporter permease [Micromonospora thermarum]